jgi:hypothetical protein
LIEQLKLPPIACIPTGGAAMSIETASVTIGGIGVDKGRASLRVKREIAIIVIASPSGDFIDGRPFHN